MYLPQIFDVAVCDGRCGNEVVLHAGQIARNDDARHRHRLRALVIVGGEGDRAGAGHGHAGRQWGQRWIDDFSLLGCCRAGMAGEIRISERSIKGIRPFGSSVK